MLAKVVGVYHRTRASGRKWLDDNANPPRPPAYVEKTSYSLAVPTQPVELSTKRIVAELPANLDGLPSLRRAGREPKTSDERDLQRREAPDTTIGSNCRSPAEIADMLPEFAAHSGEHTQRAVSAEKEVARKEDQPEQDVTDFTSLAKEAIEALIERKVREALAEREREMLSSKDEQSRSNPRWQQRVERRKKDVVYPHAYVQ